MYTEIDRSLQNGKWDYAISLIKKEEDLHLNKVLLHKLGWAYSKKEDYEEAITCFNKLIELEPNTAKWHYMKGYQFYVQNKWNEAIDEFLIALEIYPKYLIVKYRLAYAYLQTAGSYLQYTKDVFWKSLGQLKECHMIYAELGDDLKEKEKLIYFDICFLHGKTIQEMNNKQEEAINLLNTALKIKTDIDCQYQLSKTYFIVKNYEKALEVLPRSDKYYIKELEANILAELGKIKESNSILLKLIKYRKKDYVFCKLAENHISINNLEKALDFARESTKIGKDNYKNYLLLGKIYYKNKQYKSAVYALKKANDVKLKKFNLSCPEADTLISNILLETNNNPYDESVNKKESIISEYNLHKGFSFISDNEYGRVFVHISNIKNAKTKDLKGRIVTYKIELTEKGYNATNVYLIGEE